MKYQKALGDPATKSGKYTKQYGNLSVKITKNFHDRFLICDETVYHFGASLKDLGHKVFAVNKMHISANDILKH